MKKFLLVMFSLLLCAGVRAAEVPSKETLKAMTDKTLLLFNDALQKKDFTEFYKSTAEIWQGQTTPEKLQAQFTKNIDSDFEFAGAVKEMEPVFEPAPEINSDSVLVVGLYYATKPNRVTFKLKYLEEKGAWKLVGFAVDTVPAPKDENEERSTSSEE